MNHFQSLEPDETFHFACHPGIACFNHCCRDLSHALTPYDIIRLKQSLGLSSSEFLKRHTRHHMGPGSGLPIVTIDMTSQKNLQCPFLGEGGCSVYPDRPGFCRTYPLARIVRRKPGRSECRESFMLIREPHCLGFLESNAWTAQAWTADQGLQPYNEMSDLLMDIISLKNERGPEPLRGEKKDLFFMACYDVDRFRCFLFEKGLSEACLEADYDVKSLEEDDAALMRFALSWIKQRVFGKPQNP